MIRKTEEKLRIEGIGKYMKCSPTCLGDKGRKRRNVEVRRSAEDVHVAAYKNPETPSRGEEQRGEEVLLGCSWRNNPKKPRKGGGGWLFIGPTQKKESLRFWGEDSGARKFWVPKLRPGEPRDERPNRPGRAMCPEHGTAGAQPFGRCRVSRAGQRGWVAPVNRRAPCGPH